MQAPPAEGLRGCAKMLAHTLGGSRPDKAGRGSGATSLISGVLPGTSLLAPGCGYSPQPPCTAPECVRAAETSALPPGEGAAGLETGRS